MLLSHTKFAYHCGPSRTTNESPFMVVYGQNLLGPRDLILLHQGEKKNIEASKRAREIQELHKQIQISN